MEGAPYVASMLCYIQYALLLSFGYVSEHLGRIFGCCTNVSKRGFARLLLPWQHFYAKHVYHRISDVFNRPVASAPGARIDVIERYFTDSNKTLPSKEGCVKNCVNLGSYNYLGFADDWMDTCSESVFPAVSDFGIASTSSPIEFGTTSIHRELEAELAQFLGKEAVIVYNMGYATNSTSIPALMEKGTLIVSDAQNHSSIVTGARASRATVAVFRHNDPDHLEHVLRNNIAAGQPRTHRPWKKVMVVVEGIYSMEGEIAKLHEIVEVAKKYKAYIYVDEAHSIGALGQTGRGICEHAGVDPKDIDILMGTFTKSFAGMGGYLASSKEIISHIRRTSAGSMYSSSLSPVVAKQILTALRIISGADGTDRGRKKLESLRKNSNYFRQELMNMGLQTLGNFDSPVIPVMLYSISKIAEFSRECLKRNLAVVTVGFPATPLLLARVRFCVSAEHTKDDLDFALKEVEEVSKICHIRFSISLVG